MTTHEEYFEKLGDRQAAGFMSELLDVFQTIDDLIDKDVPVSDERIVSILYSVFGKLLYNPFFRENMDRLLPLILVAISAYEFSTKREKAFMEEVKVAHQMPGKKNLSKVLLTWKPRLVEPFVRRNTDVNILSHVLMMCRGIDAARNQGETVWSAITEGERFNTYIRDLIDRAQHSLKEGLEHGAATAKGH